MTVQNGRRELKGRGVAESATGSTQQLVAPLPTIAELLSTDDPAEQRDRVEAMVSNPTVTITITVSPFMEHPLIIPVSAMGTVPIDMMQRILSAAQAELLRKMSIREQELTQQLQQLQQQQGGGEASPPQPVTPAAPPQPAQTA